MRQRMPPSMKGPSSRPAMQGARAGVDMLRLDGSEQGGADPWLSAGWPQRRLHSFCLFEGLLTPTRHRHGVEDHGDGCRGGHRLRQAASVQQHVAPVRPHHAARKVCEKRGRAGAAGRDRTRCLVARQAAGSCVLPTQRAAGAGQRRPAAHAPHRSPCRRSWKDGGSRLCSSSMSGCMDSRPSQGRPCARRRSMGAPLANSATICRGSGRQ